VVWIRTTESLETPICSVPGNERKGPLQSTFLVPSRAGVFGKASEPKVNSRSLPKSRALVGILCLDL